MVCTANNLSVTRFHNFFSYLNLEENNLEYTNTGTHISHMHKHKCPSMIISMNVQVLCQLLQFLFIPEDSNTAIPGLNCT